MRQSWTKYTPYRHTLRFMNRNKHLGLTESEVLFALLCWIGFRKSHAYEIAFPCTRATSASILQMSSRLINSWRIHKVFEYLESNKEMFRYRYDRDIEEMIYS